ncbi:MAG: D-alanine--D-alanine ligase, partial [Gammaproteobacteria bacterium]|nr:D-alanine--D-alanine ligase [Gammaproteobacteria bacterium]
RRLLEVQPDRVFLILHGRGGEDGRIQGLLESLGIPYTGSGVLGSALSMDKRRAKQIWQAVGLPTPIYEVVTNRAALDAAVARIGLPVFVKPVREGSSVGATPVRRADQLDTAWHAAAAADAEVLVEKLIEGHEYTVAILGGRALPVIRLEPCRDFYDYEAKYADDAGTRYHCPCGLSADEEAHIQSLCLQAFEALDGRGWGRVDLMRGEDGRVWLLELNTAPGMTGHSLVPMAAARIGLSFEELVLQITESTL